MVSRIRKGNFIRGELRLASGFKQAIEAAHRPGINGRVAGTLVE
jgi:hypothetical protein